MVGWVNNKYKQCSHTRRSTMCWKWGNRISKCVAYHIHWMRTATERRWSRWARKAAGTSFAGVMDTATWGSNFNFKFFQGSTLLLLLMLVPLLLLLLLLLDHRLMKLLLLLLLLLLNPAPTPQAHHQPRLCRLLILILLLLRASAGGHASPSLLRYRCCCCCCCCWVNNAASISYVHVCTVSFTVSTLDHFGDLLAHSLNVSHLISSHVCSY